MVSVAEADALLAGLIPPATAERVALARAVGRVLAQPLVADRDGPPFDRVTMDGYAVSWDDAPGPWTVAGHQWAGAAPVTRDGTRTAVEVGTGAVVPGRCDTVVRYEDTVRTGDQVRLREGAGVPAPDRHVHRRGSDYRRGDTLLGAGVVLRSPHLHSLATCGVDPVPVTRRATWALAATGDELVAPTDQPAGWQIRRSNSGALAGEGAAWGLPPGREVFVGDEPGALAEGLSALVDAYDVVVTTGGVSAGAKDLVPSVLAELGVEEVFHRVAQRPGKPLWVGRRVRGGRPTVVFGLPGNPVSSLVTFRRYVVPWLLAFEGRTAPTGPFPVPGPSAPGWFPVPPGTTWFLPSTADALVPWTGSGDFASLGPSTGFVEWSGTGLVKYFPWGGWA